MSDSAPVGDKVFYSRAFALVAVAVLLFLFYRVVEPLLSPLAWAGLLAFLLHPLHESLTIRLGQRENVSALLLTLLTLVVVVGPLSGLGAALVAQLADLAEYVGTVTRDGSATRLPGLAEVPVVGPMLDDLRRTLGVSTARVQELLMQGAGDLARALGPLSGRMVLGALGTLTNFALMLVLLFFALRDGDRLVQRVRALIPMPAPLKVRLADHLGEVSKAVVYGSGVTAVLQGTLVGLAFWVLDLPSPLVFGVMAGLFALLPIGGTALVWGPAVLVLLAQQRWLAAGGLAVWGFLLVGTIDNLLRPVLVSGRVEVSTATIFVGVLGGIAAFGFIGLVAGPVILALIIALTNVLAVGRPVTGPKPARSARSRLRSPR